MFNNKDKDELPVSNLKKITPLRDFHILHNEHDIKIVKGEDISVPKQFIQNLKTEKVI